MLTQPKELWWPDAEMLSWFLGKELDGAPLTAQGASITAHCQTDAGHYFHKSKNPLWISFGHRN